MLDEALKRKRESFQVNFDQRFEMGPQYIYIGIGNKNRLKESYKGSLDNSYADNEFK
jgi:hypothetical protein